MFERIIGFFAENTPAWREWLIWGPPAALWALACLYAAGRLKRDAGLKTGYSRKTFHFLIFGTVAALYGAGGTRAVCLFGAMTSAVIFYAVWRGPGHLLYEAMAREKDAPHRTYFVLVPYVATLVGGLASTILFGGGALAGWLVNGVADAVAEPVGTRFGRHIYRVPSGRGVPAVRSLEGSAAVFAAAVAALALAAAWSPDLSLGRSAVLWVPAIAGACAAVEAVSPHGWDNLTLQLVPSFLAALLLR